MRERWVVDGFELTDGAVMDVELRAGLYATAPLAGENGTVPNRSGEVWRPKRRGAVGFGVNLWLGDDAPRREVDRLYDDVIQALGDGSRLPLWRRHLEDGSVRETRAEVVAVLSPQPIGQKGMRLAIEAKAPSGVWEATVDATQQTPQNPGSGTVLTMTNFGDDITAPMERLTFEVIGACTDPVVTDVTNGEGESFKYVGRLGGGDVLTINSETWGVTGTGFTVDRGSFYHTGGRFMSMRTPQPRQYPALRFDYTNGGSLTRLRVTGRPTYAV